MELQGKDDNKETSPKKEGVPETGMWVVWFSGEDTSQCCHEKDSNFHMKWFYGAHVTDWSAAVLNQIHLRSQQH